MPSKYLEGKPILSSDMLLKSWNEFITNKFADQNCPREEIVSPEYHLDETELGMFESNRSLPKTHHQKKQSYSA